MRTAKFKFGIGDKVRLTKTVSFDNRQYFSNQKYDFGEFPKDRVYEIDGYGWTIDENNDLKVTYRVKAYSDDYLKYHNRLTDNIMEAAEEAHPFELDATIKSIDGVELKIGEKCYYGVWNSYREAPNVCFSFASYGEILGLGYFRSTDENSSFVKMRREFLCVNKNGKNWLDSRRFGNICNENPVNIMVNIPDDYVEKYVAQLNKEHNRDLLKEDSYDYFDVTSWLKHMGVFEKVMELYNSSKSTPKKKPTKKTVSKKNNKLEKLLAGLSEKEREQLKKML